MNENEIFQQLCGILVEEFELEPVNILIGANGCGKSNVADAITWVVTRPAHVNVDHMVLQPRDQATATRVHRA